MTLVTLIFWRVIIHQAVFFECYRAIILNTHRHWSLPIMPLTLSLVHYFKCQFSAVTEYHSF